MSKHYIVLFVSIFMMLISSVSFANCVDEANGYIKLASDTSTEPSKTFYLQQSAKTLKKCLVNQHPDMADSIWETVIPGVRRGPDKFSVRGDEETFKLIQGELSKKGFNISQDVSTIVIGK